MSKLVQSLLLACLFAAVSVAPGHVAAAADGDKPDEKGQKRTALWQALLGALPEKYKEIDVYAENDSLSQVLFRSQGTTLVFSLRTGKVEVVPHMKALFKINRITFDEHKAGPYYALWYNGRLELTFSAEK